MVATEDNKKGCRRWGHIEQSAVGKNVVPELSRPILPPYSILLSLRVTVERCQIKVAARVILPCIYVIRVENTLDHEVGECEEEAGDSTGMLDELVALEKSIKDEIRRREHGRVIGPRC